MTEGYVERLDRGMVQALAACPTCGAQRNEPCMGKPKRTKPAQPRVSNHAGRITAAEMARAKETKSPL